MRRGDYTDRFEPTTYADDEPVHVFRVDRYGQYEAGDELWMPETIWHRLRLIAAAYRLHILPVLDGSTNPVFLNPVQVETLLDELEFIAAHVADPLLRSNIGSVAAVAQYVGQGASKHKVGVEFP